LNPNLAQRSTILKLYKTLALPTLYTARISGHLNNVIKIGFEQQKLNIYGEQQATLFLTTKETKKF
jgi:hypothetical protein